MEKESRAAALVGRERELVAVRGRVEAARAGHAGTVLVGGDAGIGKTRLIDEALSGVADRVLWGGCLPLAQRGLPYLAVIDLLRGLTADERRLVPPALQTLTDEGNGTAVSRSQLFQAVLDLFERLASRQPLVAVIEDLHWADVSTLDLLDFLTGLLRDQRILVLATFRADDPAVTSEFGALLGEWSRRPGVTRLDLGPLTTEETFRLAVDRLAGMAATQTEARQLAERSGGSPFFLEQLVAAHGGRQRVPRALHELLLARTRALPADALRVLRAASVDGVAIDDELVAEIADLPVDEVRSLLRTAATLQLLTLDDDGCRFRHALLAEALHADLLPAERRDYHRSFAAALTARGHTPPARLAVHHAEAGQGGEALVAWVAAATQAERMFAFAEARNNLEAALELWDQVDAAEQLTGTTAIELRRRLAERTYNAGDAETACSIARALLAELDPDRDPVATAMMHHDLARYLLETPDHDQALELQERAVALVPATPPSRERAEVVAGLARILLYEHRHEEARARADEAIGLAQASGAVHAEVSARNTLGAAILGTDHGAETIIREALALARETHDAHEQARSLWNLSVARSLAARWQEVVDGAASTTEALRRLRPAAVAGHLEVAAHSLFNLGRWDEAVATLDAARREDPAQAAITGNFELHLARGEVEQARALQTARQEAAIVGGAHEQLWRLVEDAQAHLGTGRPDQALKIVDAVLTRAEGLTLPHLVGQASTVGLRAAADLASAARKASTEDGLAGARAVGQRCRAQILDLLDDPGLVDDWKREAEVQALECEAELSRLDDQHRPELWAAAIEGWDALEMPYYAAYCRYRWAEATLGCGGDREQVAQVLRDLLTLLDRLREVRLSTDVRRLARRARLDVGDRDGLPGETFGLTAREIEVLRHLTVGATNRQIADALYISEKTVSVHVSRILGKLQVANRGQAAATAIREGLADVTEQASRASATVGTARAPSPGR